MSSNYQCIHILQYDPSLHDIVSIHEGYSNCSLNCNCCESSSSEVNDASSSSSGEVEDASSSSETPSSSSSSVNSAVVSLFDTQSWSDLDQQGNNYGSLIKTSLDVAANRWMNHVKFDPSVAALIQSVLPGWNGISLDSVNFYTDAESNTIASCGPYAYVDLVTDSPSVKFNSVSFVLDINLAYIDSYTGSQWASILAHELGHALGIGIYWHGTFSGGGAVPPTNDFLDGTAYVGTQGAYNAVTGLSRSMVPLESSGGAGTNSAHWEDEFRPGTATGAGGQSHYGLANELMVGYFSTNTQYKLSRVSIKSLVDFGYKEVSPGGNGEGNPTIDTSISMLLDGNAPEGVHKLHCGSPVEPVKIATINLKKQ